MRSPGVARSILFAVVVSFASGPVFGQIANQTGPRQTLPKRQGFLDYALGRINPGDKDYGASFARERELVVQLTVHDLYFWSNVVALVLLTGSAAVILLQWRAMEKRELIAASLIAQLWNGRVSDKIEIGRRTEQFNHLVAMHNAEVEAAILERGKPAESEDDSQAKLARTVRDLSETNKGAVPNPGGRLSGPAVPLARQDGPPFERRAEAPQNIERNLKQRLNEAAALLEAERRRNAPRKGA